MMFPGRRGLKVPKVTSWQPGAFARVLPVPSPDPGGRRPRRSRNDTEVNESEVTLGGDRMPWFRRRRRCDDHGVDGCMAPRARLPHSNGDDMREKKWSVEILIDEHEAEDAGVGSRTRAEARLHTSDATALVGVGSARRNPRDTEVPEIGDELAVARALADLAHQLIEATAADLEAVTSERIHLTS